MTIRIKPCVAVLAAALTAASLSGAPLSASAQTPSQADSPLAHGPLIAGVCLLSQQAVIGASKAGQAATARLQQLAQEAEAQSGLATEQQAIQTEAKTLQSQQASLPAAQFQSRQVALAERAKAFEARRETLAHQVEATRQKAVATIAQAAQPLIVQAYQSHACGLLLSRDAALAGNMGNDLTPAVVQALDARLPTVTFELEPPPAPSATH